jgi:pimeloyl-ACP methyl ester carboxylesterase
VDGQRFHARCAGPAGAATTGPVVCVHGVGVSSRYMVATMAQLAATMQVYAVDLPGFGLTDKPAEALDVAGLADALAAWIRAAGLERPALLANSVGCQVAVDCAVRHPDDVGRMVLVGLTIDPAARTAPRQVLRWLRNLPGERPGQLPLMVADYADAGLGRALRTFGHAIADPVEGKLPLVQAPTLVVRGSRDTIVPQAWAEEATLLLPVRQHGVHPDEPADDMAAMLEPARTLLAANPDLALHHMHDANQDRLMIQRMTYLRVKRQRLGAAYERFLTDRLEPGGTVLLVDCTLCWPTTRVGERHVFQHGASAGPPSPRPDRAASEWPTTCAAMAPTGAGSGSNSPRT